MSADLHLHTPASDGNDSVQERVSQAEEHGLETIAITDHDSINERLEGRSREIDGIEVVTGSEIKCEVEDTGIEILGYFLDPSDPKIYDIFDKLQENRVSRMNEMIGRISDGENIELEFEDVEKYAEGPVGRPPPRPGFNRKRYSQRLR